MLFERHPNIPEVNMETISVIPMPASLERKAGAYRLPARLRLYADAHNQDNLGFLEALFFNSLRVAEPEEADIRLEIDTRLASLGVEGYSLEITPAEDAQEQAGGGGPLPGVAIRAFSPVGCFYALQTLRQLLPPSLFVPFPPPGEDSEALLPCLSIRDKPVYSWRGLLLDEARHFFGMETIMRLLNCMALLKMNTLHWHLTDDQGWRVEIQGYPRLAEVGGQRKSTQVGGFASKQMDDQPHQGFYTQEQIRQIVAYAADRHITIIPEIDFPGHFSAAVAAYPELSCQKQPIETPGHFGIHTTLACGGDPGVMTFMQNVLDEIVALFPSRFIHLGGDEAKKDAWKRCPACQSKMKELGLKKEMHLQVTLTNQLASHLARHNRRAIVWNEALEGDLDDSILVTYWMNAPGHARRLRKAFLRGYQVVFQPFTQTYCDWPHAIVTLKSAYRLDPRKRVPPGHAYQALGLQATLWSEFVRDCEDIAFSLFPRLAALSEAAWTPLTRKNFRDFLSRWTALEPRLAQIGVQGAPLSIANPGLWSRLGVLRHMLQEMRIEQRLVKKE